jgi:alkaline phosphatase D
VGRTRTTPAATSLDALTMCFACCSQYEHGWFSAYRGLAAEHPDVILHLGDYQYEYAAHEYIAPSGNVRDHAGPVTEMLANYRQRYAQYKTDPDLQAAHAVAPWLAVFDDHEVADNWAGDVPEKCAPGSLRVSSGPTSKWCPSCPGPARRGSADQSILRGARSRTDPAPGLAAALNSYPPARW